MCRMGKLITLLLIPVGILFFLVTNKGFQSGKLTVEPDWKA